ncbi:MAG: GLPGLI family protein [Bacteroidota bacterium]|nr:GLPGLI family protein [Bacteroidota bacterium]MEC8724086.1 GLPGLI family protein [Bacteroidota bacterium]
MRLNYNLAITMLLALISNSILSQDFQGKAYYFSKTTPDMSGWGNGQMTEFQKKQIAERMRGMFEKSYVLNFDRQASIFKEEEVLEAPGQKGFGGWWSSFSSGPQYKNIKTRQFIQDQEFFGRQFLITDTLQKFEWKMGTETKQIGQYLCMKATAIKKVDEFDWRSMRRKKSFEKNRDKSKADSTKAKSVTEDIEVPKTIEVTAWYTPQIPINHGPDEFWGLPGLILEVNADQTSILCSKIVMNPEQKFTIEAPDKGRIISRSDYNETVKHKMKEMREMYRGRGGRK